jgi:hypothetical protein
VQSANLQLVLASLIDLGVGREWGNISYVLTVLLNYNLFYRLSSVPRLFRTANILQAGTKLAQGDDLYPWYIITDVLISICITRRIYRLSSVITWSCHNTVLWTHPATVDGFAYFRTNCLQAAGLLQTKQSSQPQQELNYYNRRGSVSCISQQCLKLDLGDDIPALL